jgi:hypothetical protein
MHHTLTNLFAEHNAPSHATCAYCHTIAGQVLDLAAQLQKQSVEYRRLLWQWKTSPDAGMKDKYEWFKQTIDANDAAIADATKAVERMVDVQAQLDRYMADLKTVDPAATIVVNPALPNV